MSARTEKTRLCQQICQIIGHQRNDQTADTFSREELIMIHAYLSIVSGGRREVNLKGILPNERNRKS